MLPEFLSYLVDRNRILVSLCLVLCSLVLVELIFACVSANDLVPEAGLPQVEDISFAPEIWLAILTLILGTLIIVISIASQSTPKLIDIYIRNWPSLIYIWFIKLSLIQCLFLQQSQIPLGSPLLNTFLYLPLSAFLALPYVFYILNHTKTSTIIEVVYRDYRRHLRRLSSPRFQGILRNPTISARYHGYSFAALNQLDDLLNFASLKEPKALAISRLGSAIREYVEKKPLIDPSFRKDTTVAREDVTFLSIKEQWTNLEEEECVLELKGLRVLTRAYARLIDRDEFDLASLTASQFVETAKVAVATRDRALIGVMVVSFNTLMRFALKHGVRQREVRNLYNLLFFFRQFIIATANREEGGSLRRTCDFLKIYAVEIYQVSATIPAFVFLTDVCVAEVRTILIYMDENDWSAEEQEHVLDTLLALDDITQEGGGDWRRRTGVRTIQTGLALFYLKRKRETLANKIITDIVAPFDLDDYQDLTDELTAIIRRIRESTPVFWEDTDRGNLNIYYSPHLESIPEFVESVTATLGERLPGADLSQLKKCK